MGLLSTDKEPIINSLPADVDIVADAGDAEPVFVRPVVLPSNGVVGLAPAIPKATAAFWYVEPEKSIVIVIEPAVVSTA